MTIVKTRISDQRIEDLLCCALEGGSNYWYQIVKYRYPSRLVMDSIEYPHLELPIKGGSVIIKDLFDDFGEKILDREAIEKGLDLLQHWYPHLFDEFIHENEDADTGDIFLQLCLYGEVIYG